MKYLLNIFCLIWLCNFAGISQDTTRVYLDDNFEVTEIKEKALFIREAYANQNNRYHIADKYLNGRMIVEGEYSSLNPWTEDGYFKYYDEVGNLYAEGGFSQGNLIGEWVYYNNLKDTVEYTAASKMLNNSFLNGLTLPKSIPASKELTDYIQDNLQFPARARDLGQKSVVEMKVILMRNKHIIPDVVTSSHKDLDLELCRVLLTVPDSILLKGLDTSVVNNLHLDVSFKIRPKTYTDTNTNNAFVFVSNQAEFQGGDINTFRDYVQKNLVIPTGISPDSIFGRATIQFMVRYDGIVDKIKVLRSSGNKVVDDLIIGILTKSPRWQPAMQDNVIVSQLFVIPVILELQ